MMCKPCMVGWLVIAVFAGATYLVVKQYKRTHGCGG